MNGSSEIPDYESKTKYAMCNKDNAYLSTAFTVDSFLVVFQRVRGF